MDAAKNSDYYRDYPIVYTAIYNGLRRGEILGLRWSDVDFKEQTASIQQTLLRDPDGGYQYSSPKTKGSIRMISLSDGVIKIFKKLKKEQAKNKLFYGAKYSNNNLIFCKEDGNPLGPSAVSKRFSCFTKKLGLNIRFHDCRHTHATLLLKENVHPNIVKERLGHTSITTTMDTYSHVLPNIQKEAVKKLEYNLENKTENEALNSLSKRESK